MDAAAAQGVGSVPESSPCPLHPRRAEGAGPAPERGTQPVVAGAVSWGHRGFHTPSCLVQRLLATAVLSGGWCGRGLWPGVPGLGFGEGHGPSCPDSTPRSSNPF